MPDKNHAKGKTDESPAASRFQKATNLQGTKRATDSGTGQPHNARKEPLGPNTKR